MSVITVPNPASLNIGAWAISQQRFDISEQSAETGHTAARLGGPPRWRLRMATVPALIAAEAARWKAMGIGLRGPINHLAMWDITLPQPRGNARGSLTLSATLAQGVSSASITGLRASPNLLNHASFETDSNADGLADNWAIFTQGTTGTVTKALGGTPLIAGSHGSKYQAVISTTLNGRIGVYNADADKPVTPGLPYTLSADTLCTVTASIELYLQWLDGTGTFLTPTVATFAAAVARRAVSGVAPPTAASVRVYAVAYSTGGGPVSLSVDNVLLEQAAAASPYPGAATLLAGDWLQVGTGVGSHYAMVMADATANDGGNITVSIEPPARKSHASATVVAWDKPLCHYKLVPDNIGWSGVPGSSDVGGFAFDLIEDWRA